MKKRLISLMVAVVMLFSMLCPAAYADDETKSFDACSHDWVTPIRSGYSVSVPGTDYSISVKTEQCSKCKWYKHIATLIFAEFTYYSPLNVDVNGLIPTELTTYWLNVWYNTFGKNATATKFTPGGGSTDGGGVGRPKGYADDNGTPTIGADGFPTLTFKMSLNGFSTNFGGTFLYGSPLGSYSNGTFSASSTYNFTGFYATDNATIYPRGCVSYYFVAPYTGYYQVTDASCSVKIVSKDNGGYDFPDDNYASLVHVSASFTGSNPSFPSRFYDYMKNGVSKNWQSNKVYIVKGNRYYLNFYLESYYLLSDSMSGHPAYYSVSINFPAPTITVTDIGSIATINKQTNITINNDYSQTWNGNIYTDNSTNLTYIYPQYTTINEKNETVTNISNTPIIYNNETKKYYTYDTVTNNYYYITYEQPATPTPSPSPSPAPTETPSPSESPAPTPTSTPKPGGSISTPETGKPDGDTGDTTGILAVLVEIRDNMIQGFLDIKAAFVAGFAELSANFTLAIENLNLNITNIFNKKFPDQSTPETAPPSPSPSPSPSPAPLDPILPETQNLIIPKMNSNTFTDEHGTWVASGSSKYSDVFDFFHAFDRSTSDFWETNASPSYLQIEIPDPENYYIDGYIMRISKFTNRYAKEWTLQGSDDGKTWDDLDTQKDQNLSDLEEHKYPLTLRKAYKYYRLNMSNYASSMCSLSHFNLLGYDAKDVVTPTPAPTDPPSPSPAPDSGTNPTPTPKPSGDSDNSGGSTWNPFKWLTDLLKDIVETILKGLWKLLTSIFGFILWLLSLLFKLFPWMPNSGILALCAGVVVVTVIRIIKFITGR